jgi:hypothetical protein
MARSSFTLRLCSALLLTAIAGAADALTLHVNCGQDSGLTSIAAAIKVVQNLEEPRPVTVLVTGQCQENVVIQGIDRLTLTAVNGASITDASSGKLDVLSIQDSRDVAVNGFTINAGADGVDTSSGISCLDFSVCRLSGNVIQGALDEAGFLVGEQSMATLDGDTLQNNAIGLEVVSRSSVRQGGQGRSFISRGNFFGIYMVRSAFVFVGAVVENNTGTGAAVAGHSTLVISGSISGNGSAGATVRQGSVATFSSAAISGNAGPGVLIRDLSMGLFSGSTVTGNRGSDVLCQPVYSATRGALTQIGGGTTNCVEP